MKNFINETNDDLKQTVDSQETKNEETINEESNKPVEEKVKNKPHTSTPIAENFHPDKFNPFARPQNPRFAQRAQDNEFEERVIEIKRVIKTTKGGRRFKFSALVVVGDKKGNVGYAVGKHIEVPEAIKKGIRLAKKNLYKIEVVGEQATISHEIIGHHGAARVMLKPAAEGRGIIASDTIRAIVELGGIRNIYSKNLGSNNKHNVINATIQGLTNIKSEQTIMALRAKQTFPNYSARKPMNKKFEGNKKPKVEGGK